MAFATCGSDSEKDTNGRQRFLQRLDSMGPLTIFTIPKAFRGHIGTIQRNAITSWTRLRPLPEIILFGDDEGTAATAQALGVRHVAKIARNEHGTPLLNDVFRQARPRAVSEMMCYLNADILVLNALPGACSRVHEQMGRCLIVCQRINLDVTEDLPFIGDWESKLMQRVKSSGTPGDHTQIDLFVFPKDAYPSMPDFGIGRLWFDQWLIKAATESGMSVVDVSRVAPALHQNHDYDHVAGGTASIWRGKEAEHNMKLYGGVPHRFTLLDCTHQMMANGAVRPVRLRRARFAAQQLLWDLFVRRTAGLRDALKLRRKYWRSEERRDAGPSV
jgi:hypothetical protein